MSPKPARKTVVAFAANPEGTGQLRWGEEWREMRAGLGLGLLQDRFELHVRPAVRLRDMLLAIVTLRPHLVHFSGHGEPEGILIEREGGRALALNGKSLAALFRHSTFVECVVLNACYSDAHADALSALVPRVITMSGQVPDRAAIEFSAVLYGALGQGAHIDTAFAWASSALEAYSSSGPDLARLRTGGITPQRSRNGLPDTTPAQLSREHEWNCLETVNDTVHERIAELLATLFTANELAWLVRRLPGSNGLQDHLIGTGASKAARVDDLVDALLCRGLVSDAFFSVLLHARPGRREQIESVRRRLNSDQREAS